MLSTEPERQYLWPSQSGPSLSARPQPSARQGVGLRAVEDVLRSAPLFAGIPADADALIEQFEMISVRPGKVLFRERDPGECLYVVLSGKVKLGRVSADGRENLLALMGPADQFGELSLFDHGPRMVTATAVTDTALARLPKNALQEWVQSRPEIASRLLSVLAGRLRRSNGMVTDLMFLDVPGRVAKQLLDLARRFAVDDPRGVRVEHDLSQEELGQLVGASRETVNKTLAEFAGRGWVRLEHRSLIILDGERLARRARQGAR